MSTISPISPLSISPLKDLQAPSSTGKTANVAQQVGQSFENVLNSLNASATQSDTMASQLATGQNVDLHSLVISMEENDVNFKVAMAIRDKLVDAYREVTRMAI